MQISIKYNYGNSFVENVGGSAKSFDFLFFCFFSAIICIILLGNIIFLDAAVLVKTLRVGAVCFSFVSILYCLFRIFKNLGWGVVGLYGLVLGLVYCRSPLANIAFYLLAGMSCVYTFISIKIKKCELWYGLAAGAIAAVTVIGVQFSSSSLTSFNMLNRLAMGNAHIDTLFHSSIAAMIKNYGMASTGLHGLVELPYHVFSHWIMACISTLSGMGVLEVYGIAQYIFFIPMLFFSIVSLCLILNQNNNINTVLLWSMVCFFLTAIPSRYFGNKFGFYSAFFFSESYTFSLSLLLIGLGLLYKESLSYGDMALICLLGIFITAAKGSSGLIYMGLWWIRSIFFIQKNHFKTILATISVSILVTMTVFSSAVASASILSFWPFYFIGRYSELGLHIFASINYYLIHNLINVHHLTYASFSILMFIVMHFFVSWVAIWQSVYNKGLKFLRRSPVALYSLGGIAAGLVVVSFLRDPVVYYFTSPALFISLPTFLLLCHTGLAEYRKEDVNVGKKNLAAILAVTFVLVLMPTGVALLISLAIFLFLRHTGHLTFRKNLALLAVAFVLIFTSSKAIVFASFMVFLFLRRAGIVGDRQEDISIGKKISAILTATSILIFMSHYSSMSNMLKYRSMKKEDSAFVETLVGIQKHSAIDQCFMPSEAFAALNTIEDIIAKPFVYPAVSEHPWINVVPENKTQTPYQWFGYEQYGLSSQQQVITMEPVLAMKNGRALQLTPLMERPSNKK